MFKKGDPRPPNAGRKKGSLNKKTASVMETLARNNFDIVQELIDCYQECKRSGEPVQSAIKCLDVLMPYVYPKLSKPDVNVDVFLMQRIENLSLKPKEELVEIVETEMKKLKAPSE
jgi:hypothetical protein